VPQPKAHLFERLCNLKSLERAWLDVLGHYPKSALPAELREVDRHRGRELQRLATALHERTFVPEPASLIFIPKPNHPEETRPITLVKPDDRIVQTALNHLLSPLFERQFLPWSYAYRPGRGARDAIHRITKCVALLATFVSVSARFVSLFFSPFPLCLGSRELHAWLCRSRARHSYERSRGGERQVGGTGVSPAGRTGEK